MRWLLLAILLSSLFIGCGVTPRPYLIETRDIDQVPLEYEITSQPGHTAVVTRVGEWKGRQEVDSRFLENIVGIIVEIDGDRARYKNNIELNRKTVIK